MFLVRRQRDSQLFRPGCGGCSERSRRSRRDGRLKMEPMVGIVIRAAGRSNGRSSRDFRIQGQGGLLCGDCLAERTSYIIEVVVHGRSSRTGNFLIFRRVARESTVNVSLDRVADSTEPTAVERMPAVLPLGEIERVAYFAGFMVRRDHVSADAAAGLESGGCQFGEIIPLFLAEVVVCACAALVPVRWTQVLCVGK
jgi:hypothetical protein